MSSEDELFSQLRRKPIDEVAKELDRLTMRITQQFQNALYPHHNSIGTQIATAQLSQAAYESVLRNAKEKYLKDNGWTLSSFNEAYARKMIDLAIEEFNNNISALTALYTKPFDYTPASITYGDKK